MASAQKMQNLSGLVNTDVSSILNAEGRPIVRSLFSSDCSQVVRSDADEQLLVNVVFKTTVKIKAITITAPDGEERPALVKLYTNQRHMDFDNTSNIKPTQQLKLTAAMTVPQKMLLVNYVKFQNVATLSVFIEENDGGEQTSLQGLAFYGEPVEKMDMANWAPIKG